MTDGHCFISYSNTDGLDFATKLADELQGRHPFINVWFDKREMDASIVDWDDQLASAITGCKCLVFVMTVDSTGRGSTCKEEWTWALKYKKPVICLLKDKKAEVPFRLNNRQYIDISSNFDSGIAQLRTAISRLDEPEGLLDELNRRLSDANRDLRRARSDDQPRIKAEIDQLTEQIKRQEEIVKNPKAAEEKTEKNIQSGLERERQPEKPVAGKSSTKFINPPPGVAPTYYQDRLIETKQIVDFLKNDAQRLMTIVGRAGVGKTAMICRLLKGLERGALPDDLGEMKVDGIVYLSETGSHRIGFANIFADLSKLLPNATCAKLESLYKNPQTSTGDKMRALLDSFPEGRFVLLLDNFENLVDAEILNILDSELSDALNALLLAPQHAIKVIITTRIAPRDLAFVEPGRQHPLSLDDGLESPYAENVLREMDADGRVGLKTAPDALLNKAREKTRGYPRALEALYAILSVDRYTTLEELLELDLPKEIVEKLVGEAFNRLDPNAQKVMQALAIYNRPVSSAAIDYLLQPHLPSIDSALVLNRLVNMHFARREAGRYYLHPADKEYAFGIIPEKVLTTKDTKVTKENQKDEEALLEIQPELDSLLESSRWNAFTQHDLLNRAADFFAQARKPRAEWKKLDDLSAQLAEFELRCEAGDYDTAASVLRDIDFHYLDMWGHYQLLINMRLLVKDKIQDIVLRLNNLEGLGWIHSRIGKIKEAISIYQQGLDTAREAKDRNWEGNFLSSLGSTYNHLGNAHKAIDLHEEALAISREIGDRQSEGGYLGNLGISYYIVGNVVKTLECLEKALVIEREFGNKRGEGDSLNNLGELYTAIGQSEAALKYYEQALLIRREISDHYGVGSTCGNISRIYIEKESYSDAIQFAQESIAISQEINSYLLGSRHNYILALAYLFQHDLVGARATIETALQYDVPSNNHNATGLHGIIALRQGERETAQEAFNKSIAQAADILAKTPEFYEALDAKGLVLCGLILCRSRLQRDTGDAEELSRSKRDLQDAIETFRAARKIAPHAGVVKQVLRLFDELVKCDEEGILKDVRNAVEGKS